MESLRIRIRDSQRVFETAKKKFDTDSSISDHNKQLMTKYIRDAKLGKTVINKRKKKIGYETLNCYLLHLQHLIHYCKKDLDTLTQDDMERFIEALDDDVIRSRKFARTKDGRQVRCNDVLSEQYKTNIKKNIKKFYKWLLGNNRQYPSIVEWIDTYYSKKHVQPLTEEDVNCMRDYCRTPRDRALIQTLFEAGTRIAEHLSIRLEGVQFVKRDQEQNHVQNRWDFVVLQITESKTVIRPVWLGKKHSIKDLIRWLECHPAKPEISQDGTLATAYPEAALFPMSYDSARITVGSVGARALNQRVYPHLLRHSGATYDAANGASHFDICKKYGWDLTSDVPKQYIDRAGLNAKAIAQMHQKREKVLDEQESKEKLPVANMAKLKTEPTYQL